VTCSVDTSKADSEKPQVPKQTNFQPTVLKLNLNDGLFENKDIKERLIEEYSHKVNLRKLSSDIDQSPAENSDNLAFCDLSVIDYNKRTARDPNQTEMDIFDQINDENGQRPQYLIQGAEIMSVSASPSPPPK